MFATPDNDYKYLITDEVVSLPNVNVIKKLSLDNFEPFYLPEGGKFIMVSVDDNGVEINASTEDKNHKTSSKLGYDPNTNTFVQPDPDTQYNDYFFVRPNGGIGGKVQGECSAFDCNIVVSGKIHDDDGQPIEGGITLRITRSNLN
jgi:hypothetical protein